MAEMMLFPETWEEFEKQFGFYDIKKAYTFGNTRFIPSFRVQQWLDHIDDIKRKKQSQNNKMEQYCKLPITAYQTDKEMDIETLEGVMHANVGDYIITGVNGEQYPCKPNIFAKTYIKYGQANKMEQIAKMFGKELGEEFTVKNKRSIYYHLAFTDKGLTVFGTNKDITLRQLLTGEAVIVNE